MKKLLLLIAPLFLCLITFSQSDTNINQKIASYEDSLRYAENKKDYVSCVRYLDTLVLQTKDNHKSKSDNYVSLRNQIRQSHGYKEQVTEYKAWVTEKRKQFLRDKTSPGDYLIKSANLQYTSYLLTISSTVALAIRNNHLKKNPDQERFVYDATIVISGSMLFVSLITNLASIKEKKKAGLLLNQNGIGLKIDL
jgi:hypothetical protein